MCVLIFITKKTGEFKNTFKRRKVGSKDYFKPDRIKIKVVNAGKM